MLEPCLPAFQSNFFVAQFNLIDYYYCSIEMPISTEIDPTQISGLCRFYEKEYPDLEECGK